MISQSDDEQIVPPADIQRWIASLRPRLNDSSQQLLPEKQQQPLSRDIQSLVTNLQPDRKQMSHIDPIEQQPLPMVVQNWITGLRSHLEESIQPSPDKQQQQEKQSPTDLTSWMQGIAPVNLHSPADITVTQTTITVNDDETTVTGDLGTWLHDWSKSLAEQPPPTSLDNWLQGLVSNNLNEPIGKAASSKARLNSYLNAAEKVLSKHGYEVSSKTAPSTTSTAKTPTGMFGNVKQMYFLWKTLDKNNDRKITVIDVQIMLEEMGLGFVSKYVAQTLFDMMDSNHDGELQFRDFIALMGIIKELLSALGSAILNA